jgi:hypothetical protein
MKKTTLILLLTAGIGQAIAQGPGFGPDFSTRRNAFGLRLGFNRMAVLDQNTSSLVYRGNIPMLGFEYQAYEENGYLIGRLQLGHGSFASKSYPGRSISFLSQNVKGETDTVTVPMSGANTLGRLEFGYLQKINPGRQVEVAAGGIVSNELFYPQGFTMPGLMNVAALSPALQLSYLTDAKSFFSIGLTMPLVSAVSRSAYHNSVSLPGGSKAGGFFRQGTAVQGFNQHRQMKIAASWHYRVGSRWLAGLHYDFRALKNAKPRELSMTQHELSISMQYIY